MSLSRRAFVAALSGASALWLASGPVLAQVAGKDYAPINPVQATENPSKVEVVEFFSYGCPHCADLHPLLTSWAARQPADVVVRKIPVTFGRAAWANIAKLYYTLEITGDLARLESDIFRAIHQERTNLFDERVLTDWVAAKGVDRKRFADTFGSFGVQSKVRRGDQMAQAYRIQGVPALAVDGKFMVDGAGFPEMLANADKLIVKARAEKAGKK